jgi:uroporphyrinogen decarboxylase
MKSPEANSTPNHRGRVITAIAHKSPDRVPVDFAAEPEVWEKLLVHFNTDSRDEVLLKLDVDCRVISYDLPVFSKMAGTAAVAPEGLKIDVWGARRRHSKNVFAAYDELCDYPLAGAGSVNDLKKYSWPSPDWWDFSELEKEIDRINPQGQFHLRFRIGSVFETAWSLCGIDKMLEDLILRPELPAYIMDRITEVHIENLKRVMKIAGHRIDMLYSYDDLAGQQGLLVSPQLWHGTIRPRQQKLFALAKSYGKPLMYHCCGNICPLIDDLIKIGVDVLSPIQPLAMKMDFQTLKRTYGSRLTFHGGIDIQQLLPNGTPRQIINEAKRASRILGENGGYILAPAHHVQADTPLENILALYGCL